MVVPMVMHQGKSFLLLRTEEAAQEMWAHGAAMDRPRSACEKERIEQATAAGAMEADGNLFAASLIGGLDMDGAEEWEELQAGSVMKKRKKAMNKHKWKKRRKRDRNYDR